MGDRTYSIVMVRGNFDSAFVILGAHPTETLEVEEMGQTLAQSFTGDIPTFNVTVNTRKKPKHTKSKMEADFHQKAPPWTNLLWNYPNLCGLCDNGIRQEQQEWKQCKGQ